MPALYVTYGSDWDNIPEPDPWFAMEGMITRQYPGHPEYGTAESR